MRYSKKRLAKGREQMPRFNEPRKAIALKIRHSTEKNFHDHT